MKKLFLMVLCAFMMIANVPMVNAQEAIEGVVVVQAQDDGFINEKTTTVDTREYDYAYVNNRGHSAALVNPDFKNTTWAYGETVLCEVLLYKGCNHSETFMLELYDSNNNLLTSHKGYFSSYSESQLVTWQLTGFSVGTYKIRAYSSVKGNYDNTYYSFKVKSGLSLHPILKDVSTTAWYATAVSTAWDKDIMLGTDSYRFSPDAKMSRGMGATVLYRLAGSPSVAFESRFRDVKQGLWYSIAITWASQAGVVNGYNNGNYGPDDSVTREQMCALIYNFMRWYNKKAPTETTSLKRFKDYKNVTSVMNGAVAYAVASGFMSGTDDGYLNPTKTASRAECAALLVKLASKIGY